MFKHLLVPLDGSKMAEVALPVAVLFSQKLGAVVTLIHILEQDAPQEIHGDRHLTNEEDAYRYLNKIAKEQFAPGVVDCHVHTEKVQDVARSIVDHSSELEPDLIVMCTHGEGGLHEFIVGSIAQQVVGRGKTPILLIHPEPGASDKVAFKKILVALDVDKQHDASLPVAAELAQRLGSELHLLTVVPTLGTLGGEQAAAAWMLPGATRAMLDMDVESAGQHLEQLAAEWRKVGVRVTTAVRRGDPAPQIVNGAVDVQADFIALATHGKAGMSAFWSSSVGPKVITSTHLPLLLIPVKK
jgi:nucleotide-binding universal stress UspA family protein